MAALTPTARGSIAHLTSIIEETLPDGWAFEYEEDHLEYSITVEVYPTSGRLEPRELGAAIAARVLGALNNERSIGCSITVRPREEVASARAASPAPSTTSEFTFAERMRRVRGDFGSCSECGEAFDAHSDTVKLLVHPKPARLHAGCVLMGTCAACFQRIYARDAFLEDPALLHDNESCLKRYIANRAEAELRHRVVQKHREVVERERGKARALRAWAEKQAREGHIVGLLVHGDRDAEARALEVVADFPKNEARIVSTRRGVKAIALTTGRGQVIVEAFNVQRFTENPGYDALGVEADVVAKYPASVELLKVFGIPLKIDYPEPEERTP